MTNLRKGPYHGKANRKQKINIRQETFICALVLALFSIQGNSETYTCLSPNGNVTYTQKTPCKDSTLTPDQFEQKQREAKQRREAEQARIAQAKARQEAIRKTLLIAFEHIDNGRVNQAKIIANNLGLPYERVQELHATHALKIETRKQQLAIEKQQRLLAEQNAQLRREQQLSAHYRNQALIQEQQAADAQAEAAEAAREANRIRSQASTPKFVPSTGQWCQDTGGSMNCW